MRFSRLLSFCPAASRRNILATALFAAGLMVGAAPAAAEGAKAAATLQKDDVEKIVRDYIHANPDIVRDAIDELQKREKLAEAAAREQAINTSGDKLTHSRHQAVVGNPNGDVTIVEFFDYNCGYCKRSLNDLQKLVEADPKLRVVLKDFAILGPSSVEAAQVATAIREQFNGEKFFEFHKKLLSTKGSIGKAQALAAAKELGADMDRLEKDLKSPTVAEALKEVAGLAEALHFDGTPAWVIGKDGFVGGLPFATLKAKIDNFRKCGKTAC